ncbi:activating signal cointegrator 1 complex subunit 2-like [Sarcoptes scabiei]|nr:activating signal cointegrator 1 complex subunit 2-like [Sarcoptes scabiei]
MSIPLDPPPSHHLQQFFHKESKTTMFPEDIWIIDKKSRDGNQSVSSAMKIDESSIKDAKQDGSKNYKCFDELLSQYGFLNLSETLFKQTEQLYPGSKWNDLNLTNDEIMLSNRFKCSIYDDEEDDDDDRRKCSKKICFFSSNSSEEFAKHLQINHCKELSCFYCQSFLDDYPIFQSSDELIDHQKSELNGFNYQCNLCLYRAKTSHHVLIHQSFEHTDSFVKTLKSSASKLKSTIDENEGDSNFLIKSLLIEDYDENNENFLCKIIDCSDQNQSDPSIDEEKNANLLLNTDDLKKNGLFCVYCTQQLSTSLKDGEEDYDYWVKHFVQKHPNKRILAYDNYETLDSFRFESQLDAKEFLNELLDQLEKTSTVKLFDENIMQQAFDWFNDEAANKGTKRKSDEVNDDDETDGADTSCSNKNKRRRLLSRLIPDSLWAKTKTTVSIAATVFVALGLSQFAQLIPTTLQKLIDYDDSTASAL